MSSDTTNQPDDPIKARAALLRSMSLTRMLDYGMDHWDATQLTNSPVDQPWHTVAADLADTQLLRAAAAAERGNLETAVDCYRRAAAALIFAQMAFNADVPPKRELYRRLVSSYRMAAELDPELRVERLEVPHRSSWCAAWLIRPRLSTPAPVVVIIGGQSGWGPAYHRQAHAFARRGLSTVLLETPGQGESRLEYGLHLDASADAVFSGTLDLVRDRTGYDGPAGVWGNSFGGLLAARAAVYDDRFAACCVNGAIIDPMPSKFRNASEQSQALLGVEADDDVATILHDLWLDPVTDHMRARLLVLHGGLDPLVTLEQQQAFLPLSTDAHLRIWDDGEHTIYNHSAERTDFACDWFRAALAP